MSLPERAWAYACMRSIFVDTSKGYIKTNMTAGHGATKLPHEGTVSLRKCLFEQLPSSGYFYGSDGLRSPLHYLRNPGEPEYDGALPSW